MIEDTTSKYTSKSTDPTLPPSLYLSPPHHTEELPCDGLPFLHFPPFLGVFIYLVFLSAAALRFS